MIHVADGNAQERTKFAQIWRDAPQDYAAASPGFERVDRFIKTMSPAPRSTVIDVGCGTGKAGLELERRGLYAWWLDITTAGLELAVVQDRFLQVSVWNDWRAAGYEWDYGYCCNVLECLPLEYTMLAATRVIENCAISWFDIAMNEDEFGKKQFGQSLYISLRPYSWWLVRLATLGTIIDARDLGSSAIFAVKHE